MAFDIGCFAEDNAQKVSLPKRILAKKKTNTSIQISWETVSGVSGYQIFRYNKASKKYKKIKTLKGTKSKEWIDKNLEKNTIYKYKIRTYKNVDGKKEYSKFSRYISAKTYLKNAKIVNAGVVKYNVPRINLGIDSCAIVKATPTPSKYSKAKNKKVISKKIRWISANPEVADVDYQTGRIHANTRGKTMIYAIAHNGRMKSISVTVADYPYPTAFNNLGKIDPKVAQFLTDFDMEFKEIADALSYETSKFSLWVDNTGYLDSEPDYENEDIKKQLTDLLSKTDGYIFVEKGYVSFVFEIGKQYVGVISYEPINYTDAEVKKQGRIKLADCWYYEKVDAL